MSLLMILGPVELSPGVRAASAEPPLGHTAPALIASFGAALRQMRTVWGAGPEHQPFVFAGSGTLAMEVAATNLLDPGQRALVVDTGVFSDRMARILGRRGVEVERLTAAPGATIAPAEVAAALQGIDAVFATHVDTSTGVRIDVAGIAAEVRRSGALFVVDGVCSVGGEPVAQADWGADVVLTASQKALSVPPGLALLVASPRALEARRRLRVPPPLVLDLLEWLPIHQAYEEGRPSYFATPATGLVRALQAGLDELVAEGPDIAVARHRTAALAMRRAFGVLGLTLVPERPEIAAHTLSALWLPEGVDPSFPGRVAAHGVLVAGGLHPDIRARYFRVGHLGWVTSQPALLAQTVRAVGLALREVGHDCDVEGAVAAL